MATQLEAANLDGYMPRVPTLGETRRVPDSELALLAGHQALIDLLAMNSLSIHADAGNCYWFRIEGENIHEHDQWTYAVKPGQRTMGESTSRALRDLKGWEAVEYNQLDGCRGGFFRGTSPLMASLRYMSQKRVEIEQLITTRGLPARSTLELSRWMLLADRAFGSLFPQQILKLAPSGWNAEVHDLLFHYEDWVSRSSHPLPRDIMLRMYGFGEYVEELAAGHDWLV